MLRRNKIKRKYLNLINTSNNNFTSDNIEKIEKKIIKALISFSLIILMLLWGIIPNIILLLLNIDINTLNDTTIYIITLINDILFLTILISIYYKSIKKNLFQYFKYNLKENLKTSISYWLIGLGIMVVSNLFIAIIMNGQLADNEETVRNMIDIAPLYMLFQLAIYAPISEELIFRRSIRDIFDNKWLYALVSGLIFGGLHVISSITNLTSLLYLIPYCSLGIVFALLYYKTNNIFSSITVHALHNTLALILYLIGA